MDLLSEHKRKMSDDSQTTQVDRDDREQIIESICEKSGLEDEEYIGKLVDENIIQAEDSSNEILPDKYYVDRDRISPTISDDISNLIGGITDIDLRHKANIENVNVQPETDEIRITFSVNNTQDNFVESYNVDGDEYPEELVDLFILADVEFAKPKRLVGNEVPIITKYYRSYRRTGFRYRVHYPPRENGISKKVVYRIQRAVRDMKLIQRGVNNTYTPTIYTYSIPLILIALPQLFNLGIVGATVNMLGAMMAFMFLLINMLNFFDQQ